MLERSPNAQMHVFNKPHFSLLKRDILAIIMYFFPNSLIKLTVCLYVIVTFNQGILSCPKCCFHKKEQLMEKGDVFSPTVLTCGEKWLLALRSLSIGLFCDSEQLLIINHKCKGPPGQWHPGLSVVAWFLFASLQNGIIVLYLLHRRNLGQGSTIGESRIGII